VGRVTVIDYGAGNLLSVARALRHCGADVIVSDRADDIGAADRLVLPGVGAFGDCMRGLNERDLVAPVLRFAETERPFLGICVGMQIMMELGEEFGEHRGLGLLPGKVSAMPRTDVDGKVLRLPHIGWTPLVAAPGREWIGTFLEPLAPGDACYFVHSFAVVTEEPSDRLALCSYGGHDITAAVNRGNLSGCQFHPEKSGAAGLEVLSCFLGLGEL